MPFRDNQTFLEDILRSIDAIGLFLGDMDFAAYQADLKTKRAVERMLQILSEAAYRLGDHAERLCPSIDWRGVRGLGNVLRHEYQAVDDERLWRTLRDHLPVVHDAFETALAKLQSNSPAPPA